MYCNEPKTASPLPASSEYLLTMRRIDTANAQEVVVDFAPAQMETAKNCAGQVYLVTVKSTPTFNNDNDYFTPAFLLREDQIKIQRNPCNVQMFHDMHAHKLPDLTASSEHFSAEQEIYVPRPSSSKFCHVCRVAYDDYLSHTEMDYHHHNIASNKFSQDIARLCQKLRQPHPQKTKRITKNNKRNKASTAEQRLLVQAI